MELLQLEHACSNVFSPTHELLNACMQAARLCELCYSLDFRLIMLRQHLMRANNFRREDNVTALHCKVVELLKEKEQITQEDGQMIRIIRQGVLQMGEHSHTIEASLNCMSF